MGEMAAGYLELADWRRRVADLYAEVRRLAASDPAAAWAYWRAIREHLYRMHPQSPVPAHARASFEAQHFPYDPALRFAISVVPDVDDLSRAGAAGAEPAPACALPVSTGDTLAFYRIGWIDVPFPAGPRRLALYWMLGYAGGLFLPFRDTTNGNETYGAGRYVLDTAKGADLGIPSDPPGAPGADDLASLAARPAVGMPGPLIVDFNFGYHPSCVFDPRWACPLAPPESRLDVPIRVGERLT